MNNEIQQKANPNAIIQFGRPLNNRQQKLLEGLNDYDSKTIVKKSTVKMSDLSALTAQTGDEFAMFSKGGERLIIRGNERSVNVDTDYANELYRQGYKWSGHTHPGYDFNSLQPSTGDYMILDCFKQHNAVIYNSKGNFNIYEKG